MAGSSMRSTFDARRAQRFPTNFVGEIVVLRKHLLVMITNISRGGALLKADDLPSSGEEVILTARSLDVVGTVAWAERGFAGIRFHRDIDPLEIVRQNADEMRLFRTMRSFGAARPA